MDVGRFNALNARNRDLCYTDVPAAAHTDDFANYLSNAERAFIHHVLHAGHDVTLSRVFRNLDKVTQHNLKAEIIRNLMVFCSWPCNPRKAIMPTSIPGNITSTVFCMPQVGNLLTFLTCKQADDIVKGERKTGFGHT